MGGELERRELLVTHTRVAHCMHNRHSSYTLPVSVPRDLSVARRSRVMREELRESWQVFNAFDQKGLLERSSLCSLT